MDVKIDQDAMQALVAKAVFDGMTPDKREALLTGAIKSLMETPRGNDRNYFGEKTSPLQTAFNRAVETVAMQHAVEFLSNDADFQTRLKSLFADVANSLFAEGDARSELVRSISLLIRTALTKDRY